MSKYRAGQRIRAEWPDGGAVEGVCEWRPGNDLVVPVGDIVVGLGALLAKDCTVTILSEPRPEEPTGLGAVVEASCIGFGGRLRWVAAPDARDRHACPVWIAAGMTHRLWDDLIDPVVLAEGWTP